MHVPRSVGVLVASCLLTRTLAQPPEYGGSQGDNENGPGTATQVPGAGPFDGSNSPSCILQGTTTVFVTVLPTSPSDGSNPNSVGVIQTVTKTLEPTTVYITAGQAQPEETGPSDGTETPDSPDSLETPGIPEISDDPDFPGEFPSDEPDTDSDGPMISASGTYAPHAPSAVTSRAQPFTTLTIDIWGSGGNSEPGASQTAPGPVSLTRTHGNPKPSSGAVIGPSHEVPTNSGNPENMPDTPDFTSVKTHFTTYASEHQASSALPVTATGQASAPSSYGSPGSPGQQSGENVPTTTSYDAQRPKPNGPQHTIVTDTDVYWTTGPAGPSPVTVLHPHTITLAGSQDSSNVPATQTVFGPDGGPTVIIYSSNNSEEQGPYPSASMTVTGPDGVPTVIVSPAETDDQENAPSMTITGTNGIPTVFIGSTNAPNDGNNVEYPPCVRTVTGVDGKPTVIIKSAGNGPDDGQQSQTAQFPQPTIPVPNVSGFPSFSGFPGGASASISHHAPVLTSAVFTVTGADGRPTVLQSTWAIPTDASSHPTLFPATGLPVTTVSGALPTNEPHTPDVGAGIMTSFTFTYTGMDGLPTAVESTVLVTPTGPVSFASSALPTGLPRVSGNVPGDDGITTCFTYLTTGADGLPTMVDQTVVIPNTNPGSNIAGLPTNVPITPGTGPAFPGGAPVTTCFSHTFTGMDGRPTVLSTTITVDPAQAAPTVSAGLPGFPGFPGPVFTHTSIGNLPPSFPTGMPSGYPTVSGLQDVPGGVPVLTTFTYTGADGRPTIVEAAYTASNGMPNNQGVPTAAPVTTSLTMIGPDGRPTVIKTVFTDSNFPMTQGSALPGSNNPQITPGADNAGVTTCATLTIFGADGLPTVVDSTWVVPGPINTLSAFPVPFPQVSGLPSNVLTPGAPGQMSGIPGLPSNILTDGTGVSTTCTSYTLLGTDGLPTVVEATWTVPAMSHAQISTKPSYPSAVTPISALPQGVSSATPGNGAITTSFTAISIGSNGLPTPVVQTVVFTPGPGAQTAGVPGFPVPSDYAEPSPFPGTIFAPFPPNFTPIFTDGSALPGGPLPPFVSGTLTGTRTATYTVTSNIAGPVIPTASGLPPSYDASSNLGDVGPAQQYVGSTFALPTELTLWPGSAVKTSTWTNVIPEPTTTYTMNYPMTTLVTRTGANRMVRRQEMSASAPMSWVNSSTPVEAPLTPLTPLTPPHNLPISTPTPNPVSGGSTMCAAGGKIGKQILDFDAIKPGPLYNPAEDFWFSEGFSVAPPSSHKIPYTPSSGGQLIQFVPPSLMSPGGGSNTAEFGVGPHFASPCFKFDLYGLDVGCAAQTPEQWCEFEISAYAYNSISGRVESTSWSEVKRVPACSNYATGGCPLTTIDLEGYTGITSVLVTLRVGLDLRVWWGDDIRVGWTDNTCDAAICRADASTALTKRELTDKSVRHRLWSLTSPSNKIYRGDNDMKKDH